jgi:hypothetical protein
MACVATMVVISDGVIAAVGAAAWGACGDDDQTLKFREEWELYSLNTLVPNILLEVSGD